MSSSEDNSHSLVRTSHGVNKLVTNLNNNELETSEVQFVEYALRLNAGDFASRSKAKAKPQRRDSASTSTRTFKTTPQMTRFRDAKACNNLATNEIDDHRIYLQLHKWTSKSRRTKIYTWYHVYETKPIDKTHDADHNVFTKTQSTFHTAHMNLNTGIDARVIPCAHSPVVRFLSSWFALHIVAQV